MRRTLLFNDGTSGSLTASLSRGYATYDPTRADVATDEIRYDVPRAVAGTLGTPAVVATPGGANWQVVGSGLDADGVTPVCLLYSTTAQLLKVYRGTTPALQRTISCVKSGSPPDLLASAPDANWTYDPSQYANCLVIHGLLAYSCMAYRLVTGTWTPYGMALLVSHDLGATWAHVDPRAADADADNAHVPTPTAGTITTATRFGNVWATSWTPRWSGGFISEAVVTATDYMNTPKAGGFAFVCRARRTSVSGAWAVTQGRVFCRATDVGATSLHAHSAAVTFKHAKPVVFTVFGDLQNKSVVEEVDDWENFLTSTTTKRESLSPGASGTSFQGISLWTTRAGDFLCGSDNEYGAVHKIVLPSGIATAGVPTIKDYVPQPIPTETGSFSGSVVALRLNDGTEAFRSICGRREGSTVTAVAESWAETVDGGERWAASGYQSLGLVFYGPDLLVGTDGTSLYTVTRPTITTLRPALVQPGGGGNYLYLTSMAADGESPTGAGNLFLQCPYADGVYRYPTGTTLAGQPIDPQPPVKGEPVFYAKCNGTQRMVCWRSIVNTGVFPIGQNCTGPAWVMRCPWSGVSKANGPSLKVGKDGQSFGAPEISAVFSSNGSWEQWHWHTGVVTASNNIQIQWHAGLQVVASEFLVTTPGAHTGHLLPYPSQPDARNLQNERLTVSGFALGGEWTIGVATRAVEGTTHSNNLFNLGASQVYATLYADASNYVQIRAANGASNLVAQTLLAEVVVGGSVTATATLTGFYVGQGASLRWTVERTSTGIRFRAKVNGKDLGTATATTGTVPVPTEVRFASADWSTVIPQAVIGVAVDERTAVNAELYPAPVGTVAVGVPDPADVRRGVECQDGATVGTFAPFAVIQ